MGTSTVSGPFRSENGFQELVNGVWTPVGGGGGGGITTIIVPNASGPTLVPAMTVGQTIAFAGGPDAGNDYYYFSFPVVDGTNSVAINGIRIKQSFPYNTEFISVGGNNPYSFDFGNGFSIAGKFYFLLTYVGITPYGFYPPVAGYRVFGMG